MADIAVLVELVPHPAGTVGYRAAILGLDKFNDVLVGQDLPGIGHGFLDGNAPQPLFMGVGEAVHESVPMVIVHGGGPSSWSARRPVPARKRSGRTQ